MFQRLRATWRPDPLATPSPAPSARPRSRGRGLLLPALAAGAVLTSLLVPGPGAPPPPVALVLTVNGATRALSTTAPTVGVALHRLGLNLAGAYLSTPARTPIPAGGLAMTVRTPQRVALVVDGVSRDRRTTAPTVAALLAESGVHLGAQDRITPGLDSYPGAGTRVQVVRVQVRRTARTHAIPAPVRRQPSPALPRGQVRVSRAGRPGARASLLTLVLDDGRVVTVVERTTAEVAPVPTVVLVGTGPAPAASAAPAAGPAVPAAAAGLNWSALAACESGGNPRAVGGGGRYFGLYQFTPATWASLGGTGLPTAASPAEQTARAALLLARSGRGQWPVCGSRL